MWAEVRDNQVHKVFEAPHGFRDANGVLHDRSIFTRWTSGELKAVGILPLVLMGEKPTEFHVDLTSLDPQEADFTIEEDQVVLERTFGVRPLEDVKEIAHKRITVWKMEKQDSPFEYDGSMYQCDPRSRTFITGVAVEAMLAKLTNQEYELLFTDATNVDHILNADETIALGEAAAAHVKSYHEQAKVFKQNVNKATDVFEVVAVLDQLD